MGKIQSIFQIALFKHKCIFITVFIVGLFPIAIPVGVFADSSSICTPPVNRGAGVDVPVGSDASAFTYDCTSGLWVSAEYTYNPSTGIYTPINPTIYRYDPSTGLYNYVTWIWNAPTSKYIADDLTTATPPVGSDIVGAPTPVVADTDNLDTGNNISGTGTGSNNNINSNTGGNSISGTGANSNNGISGNSNNNLNGSNATFNTLSNLNNQTALTGDAAVTDNTLAGNAASGNASNVDNEINLLQSSSSALAGNAVTFVANINGNVDGNFLIDPATLSDIQPATSSGSSSNTTINNSVNTSINNNLSLDAGSGNATVASNTTAGNASSGNASNIANIVNMIDSDISSGQSFLGVININGDLNGNILIPSNFVNELVADNVPSVNVVTGSGPSSSNNINNKTANSTVLDNNNNESINNVINTNETSGNASVNGNTNAGSATTGSASSSITAFNLTGSNIIGSNDLLVFVNVAGGQWVGLILNAPPGTSAAEIGGGIVSNNTSGNTSVANDNDQSINNVVNESATSGNATVKNNTNAGNATTGSADNAVNLLNVENSSLSLSNWFGILFINVFGIWNGNFGEYTPATPAISSNTSNTTVSADVFKFDPANSTSKSVVAYPTAYFYSSNSSSNPSNQNAQNLNLSLTSNINKHDRSISSLNSNTQSKNRLFFPIFIGVLLALYYLGEILYKYRNANH